MRKKEQEEQSQRTLEAKRARLTPEPEPKTPNVTTVRVQLPDGSRVQRRFLGTDLIQSVRDVLDLYMADKGELTVKNYALESNFPIKVFDNPSATLQEVGLVPQAVLFIKDLDA